MTLVKALRLGNSRIRTVTGFRSLTAVDGDAEDVVTDPAGNSLGQIIWKFRYRTTNADGTSNANTSKWDFVGGPPVHSEIRSVISLTANSNWADNGGTTPHVTVPLGGVYLVEFGAVVTPAAASTFTGVGISIGATDPTLDRRAYTFVTNQTEVMQAFYVSLSLSDNLIMKYRSTAASGSASYDDRWMRVLPVRVTQT
jgi:hypothetical protein